MLHASLIATTDNQPRVYRIQTSASEHYATCKCQFDKPQQCLITISYESGPVDNSQLNFQSHYLIKFYYLSVPEEGYGELLYM
jgi:hypothetical protein